VQLGQVSALEGSKLLLKVTVTQLLGCTRHATSAIAIQPYIRTRTFLQNIKSTKFETRTTYKTQ
jgi:hypothetical protein